MVTPPFELKHQMAWASFFPLLSFIPSCKLALMWMWWRTWTIHCTAFYMVTSMWYNMWYQYQISMILHIVPHRGDIISHTQQFGNVQDKYYSWTWSHYTALLFLYGHHDVVQYLISEISVISNIVPHRGDITHIIGGNVQDKYYSWTPLQTTSWWSPLSTVYKKLWCSMHECIFAIPCQNIKF
jgi:hypothetical protein